MSKQTEPVEQMESLKDWRARMAKNLAERRERAFKVLESSYGPADPSSGKPWRELLANVTDPADFRPGYRPPTPAELTQLRGTARQKLGYHRTMMEEAERELAALGPEPPKPARDPRTIPWYEKYLQTSTT
jgi:hypothetical protein